MSTPLAPHAADQLRAQGLEVLALDLSEFRKAGGGAKCLTLEAYRYDAA
jgi:N-dimethylarginine dimethylaminohydrolase